MNTSKVKLIFQDGSTQDKTLDYGCSIEELREILLSTVPNIEDVEIGDGSRWRQISVGELEDMIDQLQDAVDACEAANHGGCDDDYRNSYPYAAGFAGMAMRSVSNRLEAYL
jgi:hypothetical protein